MIEVLSLTQTKLILVQEEQALFFSQELALIISILIALNLAPPALATRRSAFVKVCFLRSRKFLKSRQSKENG